MFIYLSFFHISSNNVFLKIKIVITITYLFLILNPQYTNKPSSNITLSKTNIEKNSDRPILIRAKAIVMENEEEAKSLVFKMTNGKMAVASNGLPIKYMHYNQGSKFTIYYLEEKNKQIYKVYYTRAEARQDGYEYTTKPNITHTQNHNEKSGFEKLWSILKYIIFLLFVYNIYSIYQALTTNQQEATVYRVKTHPMKFNELFKFYTFKKEEEYYGDNYKVQKKNDTLSIVPNKNRDIGFFLAGLSALYLFFINGGVEKFSSKESAVAMVFFIVSLIITLGSLYFIMQENEEYKIIFNKQKKVMLFYNEEKVYYRDIFCLYQTKVMIILPSDESPYTPTYQLNVITKEGKAYCIRLTKDSNQALDEAKWIASFVGKPLFLK